ncbi:MAG: SlyX family protein [bacterium]
MLSCPLLALHTIQMPNNTIDEHIETLQISFMHQEETIERLSHELHKQQQENRLLLRRLEKLEQRLQALTPSMMASQAEETPPPHY